MQERTMAREQAPVAAMRAGGERRFAVTLTPISHPALGEIRIDENLFAIGRGEAPFVSYAPEVVGDLSRRHARIFSEYGAIYLADLGSKNGTMVNRVDVREKITKLRDGDEVCFGKSLSYRVRLRAVADTAASAPKLASLTLTPERADLGLQPVVITRFPFLISKSDEAFARYKDEYPNQVNYLSRRHAHIFLKGGVPCVEDLGSTNGTFVGGERLQEHAVALEEGALLAFGGHHFVYRVGLQKVEAPALPVPGDFTVTRLSVPPAKSAAADADKTTFVAVAGSFLDIFCIDQPKQPDAEAKPDNAAPAAKPAKLKRRGKFMSLAAELMSSFRGGEAGGSRRATAWSAALLVLLATGATLLYLNGAPERELTTLLADHEYAQAAAVASAGLARDPDNRELKLLGTEALLKANLPNWLALVNARDFGRAGALLGAMKQLAERNSEAQPLLAELEWVGNFEKFVAARGGPDAAIQSPSDEQAIKLIQRQWEDGAPVHQRAFATISAYVPEFKDAYANALSDLRKLALVVGQAK